MIQAAIARLWHRVSYHTVLPLMAGSMLFAFLLLLNAAVRDLPLRPMLGFALVAVLLTRLVQASRWKAFPRAAVLVFSGVVTVFAVSARLPGPLAAYTARYLAVSAAPTKAGWLQAERQLAGITRLLAANLDAFFTNLSIWWQNLLNGTTVYLPQPTIFVWGLVVFAVAVWMRWHLHQNARPLLAVLPGILAATLVVNFGNNTRYYFGLLTGCGVAVWILFSHARREAAWEQTGTGYSDELWLDIGWPSAWVAAFVFALVVLNPTLSIREIADRVEKWTEREDSASSAGPGGENVAPALGAYEALPQKDEANKAGLPNSHLLTDSPELRDTLLFEVRVSGWGAEAGAGTLYWRTQTFETYDGHGWQSGAVLAQELSANQPARGQTNPDRVFTDLEIRVWAEQAAGVLLFAHQFVSADQPVTLYWRVTPSGDPDLYAGTLQAESYTVRTADSTLPENRVETIPTTAAWVWSTYLQLPEELPGRVPQLAAEIVRGKTEPFAKAQAIQNYLRQFPYTLEVPLPPSNRDVVDYFLFDLQQGYCDYYATAMVVLARSVGLPARLVAGYAQGTFDPQTGVFRVTGEEAHTWVEVYFSGLGWVEFEPTAGRPLPVRASFSQEEASAAQLPAEPAVVPLRFSEWLAVLPLAALMLGLVAARLRLFAQRPAALLDQIKAQYYRLAEVGTQSDPQASTLNELAGDIEGVVVTHFRRAGLRRVGRALRMHAENSAALLSDVAYGGVSLEEIEKRSLVRAVIRVRRAVWVMQVVMFLSVKKN